MSRIEPPPIASWILEHCIPGRRDDALAGDLLEEFQFGRTHGWYWRQSLAALAVGWTKYLFDRISLIVFALLWSMLAPAWTAMVERFQYRDVAWPASVAGWLMLNLAFLWSGMLGFALLHRKTVFAVHARKLKRALGVSAAVFLPTYFATFVLANLFVWPGIAVDWRLLRPLGELVDFGARADALRLPYLVTFLWSMWGLAPLPAAAPRLVLDWRARGSAATQNAQQPATGPLSRRDAAAVHRMLLFMLAAGLVNAMIAAFLLCRLPEDHHPTLGSMVTRAAIYVLIGALAGVIGTYIYWNYPSNSLRENPPVPFSLFALICTAGWMWVPAMALFSEQVSALTALVAMVAAFLLAREMRRVLPPMPALQTEQLVAAERNLFAESLYRSPSEPYGFAIAFCLYGAGWAIAERSNMGAAILLAAAASVFVWNTTVRQSGEQQTSRQIRRAVLRLSALALPAVLVTFWALLDGVAHRNRLAAIHAVGMEGSASPGDPTPKAEKDTAHPGSGYESVILWPYPPKKRIVAPVQPAPLLAPGTKQAVVIRFTGEYWYLQPPDTQPGPHAHHATGTPLDVHIASSNSFPLIMQAHQFLRSPVRVARCGQVRVEIANREMEPGSIGMAVWLKNSSSPDASAVYLGEQTIDSAGTPSGFPAMETLVFAVPAAAKIRTFDEIAVVMLPDTGHTHVGPRVAIEQFELGPR